MFQSAARRFLDAKLKAHRENTSVRVIFAGDYKWYTANMHCNHTGHGCFFLDDTNVSLVDPRCNDTDAVEPPVNFESSAFWWSICQAYLFQAKKSLLEAAERHRQMFDFHGFPDIALHIRQGDKPISMMLTEEQTNIISVDTYLKLAEKWILNDSLRNRLPGAKVVVYVASDQESVYRTVDSWAQRNANLVHLVMAKSKLAIKDNAPKAAEAALAGDSLSPEDKFLESQQFILDLYFMMHAQRFAGLCMSQPARMVMNIGLARGGPYAMIEAVAMDEWNIEKIDNMKYGVMEGWSRLSNVLNLSAASQKIMDNKFQPLSPSVQEKSVPGAKVGVKFQWGSLSNGSHTCLPAIDESFSDVAGATFRSGSGLSELECNWFNDIAEAGLRAAKAVSSCVPNDTVFATLVNSHFWDMLIFNLQNVEERSCFMHRLLILTMDESTQLSCDKAHYKHCIPYVRNMDASDFEQTGSSDYNPITWLKSKMALALIHSNLTVFTFDSDVLLFQVPDVDAIISTNSDADIFYQLEIVDYPALYSNTSTGENDPNIEHDGFNSGQVLWRPSEMLKLAIPNAFRLGGQPENIGALDQGNIRRAIADANGWGKTQPLSFQITKEETVWGNTVQIG